MMAAFPKSEQLYWKRPSQPEAEYDQVVRRSRRICERCRRKPASEIHHVVYRSRGGTDTADNLEMLCGACHKQAHGIRVAS